MITTGKIALFVDSVLDRTKTLGYGDDECNFAVSALSAWICTRF